MDFLLTEAMRAEARTEKRFFCRDRLITARRVSGTCLGPHKVCLSGTEGLICEEASGVIVQETENCVEPGSPPRGDKEDLAIAHPDFLENLGNEWGKSSTAPTGVCLGGGKTPPRSMV